MTEQTSGKLYTAVTKYRPRVARGLVVVGVVRPQQVLCRENHILSGCSSTLGPRESANLSKFSPSLPRINSCSPEAQ